MAQKHLKKGFTTGAAASAAVKAALIRLLTGTAPKEVEIVFLGGGTRTVAVQEVRCLTKTCCEAEIVKDAGDDPDITHKALIGARVILTPGDALQVGITGGIGVGRVTKPGLEIAVGEPAINPGPRQMIMEAVQAVYDTLVPEQTHQVAVTVFVPKGEVLAKKTLNARLGIMGGISILGTTGVVTPMSHDAYIATIRAGIRVAAAKQIADLVFTTGRRSERHAMGLFPQFYQEAFVQTGDFFQAAIQEALTQPFITRIIYTVFFGKAVKMALGYAHTHAARSGMALDTLAGWARTVTGSRTLAGQIAKANTARHAFSFIYPDYPHLISHVGKKIQENAGSFAGHKLAIRVIILDFDGQIVWDSTERLQQKGLGR
ncbi:MAG: cobalt-precorrin-5B (C(1))-methyltransferase CbiD [Desulfotignum sp.]|nr:cobalt-precorrin-5B (C(1))-methyltransferase CbiD [Desulfotignum sp.]